MKKQLLSALCVTATSALIVTGCAPRSAVSLTTPETTTITPAETTVTPTTETIVTTPAENATIEVTPTEVTPAETTVTPTTETVVTPPAVEPKAPQPVIYTVTAGDSISALAVRFDLHKPDILALNPELRKNPNAIKIGQKIKLPAGTDISIKAKPRAPKPVVKAGENDVVYTVKAGDVLGGIALRHGVSVAAIKKANNLKKDTIFVGQKLTLPGAKNKAARPSKPVVTAKDTTKAPEKKPEVVKPIKEETPAVIDPAPADEAIPELEIPNVPEEAAAAEDAVPEVSAPVVPAADATTYVVKEGEDLLAVACRWNISVATLREANNIDEAAGYTLAPGTTLVIPNAE